MEASLSLQCPVWGNESPASELPENLLVQSSRYAGVGVTLEDCEAVAGSVVSVGGLRVLRNLKVEGFVNSQRGFGVCVGM